MTTISFDIQDKDVDDFMAAFLKENPVPMESTYSIIEWINEWGRQQYFNAVKRGKIKLAQESVVVDSSIISCTPSS